MVFPSDAGIFFSGIEENEQSATLELFIINDEPIGGFQLSIEGADITASYGGLAQENGFMLSSNSSTVLGFSLTGSSIPAGTGALLYLDIENYLTENSHHGGGSGVFSYDICFNIYHSISPSFTWCFSTYINKRPNSNITTTNIQ